VTTALITGASSGIGMEMARILASQHVDLVLVARRETVLDKLQGELSSRHAIKVSTFASDLTDCTATDGIFERLQADGNTVDYLINNAGFGVYDSFAGSDLERQQAMIDLNITALTRLTRHLLPAMVKRGQGKVLNVASMAAFQPGPMMSVYCATKAYVLSLSEALATELAESGVTVTTLCPGPVATEFIPVAGINKNSPFIKLFQPVSAKKVAQYGLDAMMAGKRAVVYGRINQILAFSNRIMPRKVAATIVHKVMK
jgi:short-subunit dehydrogenase